MDDRELLERAAKAAGIKIDKSETNGGGRGNTGFDLIGNAVLDWHNGTTWNPLTDDGDALRLAVNLRMDVTVGMSVKVVCANDKTTSRIVIEHDADGLSADAATRRAIVRAAAEIATAKS